MQAVFEKAVHDQEDELPPTTSVEEAMSPITVGQFDQLSKQLTKLSDELKSELKEVKSEVRTVSSDLTNLKIENQKISNDIAWIKKLGTSLAGLLILVFGHIYHRLGSIGERVAAIEGKGGSYTATERSLASATSPSEVVINLDLLNAQLKKRAMSHSPLNDVELAKIGVTLNAVATRYPDIPTLWSVSSQLVNARAILARQSVPAGLPNCWDTYVGHSIDGVIPSGQIPRDYPAVDEQHMGNCELRLDDGPQFRNSGFGRAYEKNLVAYPALKLQLTVHDAVVTYSGGKLIPFSVLSCRSCIFQIQVRQQPPSPEGQRVVRALLTADLGDVQFAGSESAM